MHRYEVMYILKGLIDGALTTNNISLAKEIMAAMKKIVSIQVIIYDT